MKVATMFIRSFVLLTALAIAAVAHAASLETQSNPVPNGFIQIDGNYSDWLGLTSYMQDTVGDTAVGGLAAGADILQGAVAHDEDFIYVLWRNNEPAGITANSNWVWFDMDNDPVTGRTDMFGLTTPLSRGTEYNLGGTGGWNQWGPDGAFTGGGAGKLAAAGSSSGSGGADFIEWSISRSALQPGGVTFNPTNGSTFQFFFITEAGANTGDNYPNTPSQDWFTYDTAGVYDVGAPGDANGDGDVTTADYLLIRGNSFTNQFLGQNGDVNDDAFVDFDDFHEWKTNFPGGAAAADAAIASLSVPEPATLSAGIVGLMGVLLAIGRRAKR